MGELAWKQQVTSSESFSGNFWRIVFPEGCLRVHQLCQYLSCGGWSKRLLSDYFVDGLGGGGFPHRQDVSDSEGLQYCPRVPRPRGSILQRQNILNTLLVN